MKIVSALLVALALLGAPGRPARAAGGASSSTGGASSAGAGSTAAPAIGGGAAGSQPVPGKRKAVEDRLRQSGHAPDPAQDQGELRTLNQISRQVAPGTPVPAPEVGH